MWSAEEEMVWRSSAGEQCQLTIHTTVSNTAALTCARANAEEINDDTSEQLAWGRLSRASTRQS